MRRHILLLVCVVMLLGCASDPPPRYTPAPEASPGTTWQRIVFPGQYTRDEAQLWLPKLEQEFGITGGWIPAPRKAEP